MAPKILLLVNSDPAGTGIGELFLSEIGRVYPAGRLVRFSTVQQREAAGTSSWLGFRSISRYVNTSRWPLFSSVREWLFTLTSAESMAIEVASIIKEEKIDIVWSVLSSGLTITLTERVMKLSQVPVVSTVLDDPEYFAKSQYIDPFTWRHMHAQFARVLNRSRCVSVISESMQSIYRTRYGVESIIIRHGVEESHFQAWGGSRSNDQIIRIGFAGSLYAKKEWNALLRMLDSVGGRIAGKDVRVSFIGRWPRTGVNSARYVDKLGQMSFESAINVLRETNIAYLPYWFNTRHSVTVRTSFPGKLSTYAACGIPVLYHGPLDSSVTPFLRDYPFGVGCHSLNESEIHGAILNLLEDAEFLHQASDARDQALDEELGRTAMLRRFCELVDCTLEDLNQLSK